ncbi:MAG: hypothetical protein LBH76_04430, partial [Propionibacteriaceae bacterium]|nr:hypothetical protein [Propionibacteriaceae bacterium]
LREAEAARAAADRASRQCEAASRRYHSCNDPELRDDHRQDYNRYNNAVCAANGDLAAAKRKLQQAIQQRDDAAQRAIRDIEDIDGDSEVTDNLLDKIIDFIENLPDWVKGVFDVIASVIEFIAEWGWVLQVAVGLVSLVFPPASAALAAITLALKVVEVANLAIKGVKAAYAGIKAINGDGPPEDFIAGLVDIGVSIGIAKAAGAAGKAVSKQIPINTGSSNIATKATDNVRDSVSGVVSGLAVPAFRNIWNGVENLWAPLVGKENQSDTYHQQICTPAPPDSGVGEW